jgi:uncharacterized protein
MKISIEDIPDKGLHLDIEENISAEDNSVVSPVRTQLEIFKFGQGININGSLKAELEFQCSRCLKTFRKELDIPMDLSYHPVDEMSTERHELKNDEMDFGFYTGTELDLQEVLKEQILLNRQLKPLCDYNCKGICPKCGTDLNTGKCFCEKREIDPRLEVLKSLLEERKE